MQVRKHALVYGARAIHAALRASRQHHVLDGLSIVRHLNRCAGIPSGTELVAIPRALRRSDEWKLERRGVDVACCCHTAALERRRVA
jgi:hypothetical protein